jgi:hypothetical protein
MASSVALSVVISLCGFDAYSRTISTAHIRAFLIAHTSTNFLFESGLYSRTIPSANDGAIPVAQSTSNILFE